MEFLRKGNEKCLKIKYVIIWKLYIEKFIDQCLIIQKTKKLITNKVHLNFKDK